MNTSLILFDKNFNDIGEVSIPADFEVGNSEALNNFEITSPGVEDVYGFYIDGTEYGGVVEYKNGASNRAKETLKGWTWRGLLTQSIITPPSGSDYRVVSGDANTIISTLLSQILGGFFRVPTTASGCNVNNYQFALYINTLDGIMNMLAEYDYRLHIHAEKETAGGPVVVYVEAVPAARVAGTYNDDSPVTIEYVYNNMGINHLVCMGSGELQNRMRVDLYINAAGKVSQTRYYTGFAERIAYYDYASAESRADFIKYGTQRLLEIASSRTITIHAKGTATLEVGDIVYAVQDGITVDAPITRKILKIEREAITQEYTVKGEN